MTDSKPVHILFLCAHNRVRSILAEALLNNHAYGRIQAFSAGIEPDERQQPDPLALEALKHANVSTDGLRSKSWSEFSSPDAPHMDLVVTVCDHSAGEPEPVWPGHAAMAQWHFPDPSRVQGNEEQRHDAYRQTLLFMGTRIELLLALPKEKLAHAFES